MRPCINPLEGLVENQTQEEKKYSTEVHKLFNCFKSLFSSKPDFIVKVPGRVNLIGEHIDYCRYSVCPMALEQNISVAFKQTENGELNIYNIDCQKYVDYHSTVDTFSINLEDGVAPQWYEYFLCGVKGIQDLMKEQGDTGKMQGVSVLVSGTIPPSAGLSSSSALVCAAVIAVALVNKVLLSRSDLASLSARAERYIGTQGGGMDQAIAFLASPGCAKHIEFHPLRSQDITLPEDAVFVVGQSLATKNKAQSSEFNTRVMECRLSAKIIAKKKELSNWKDVLYLGDLQTLLGVSLQEMIEITKSILTEECYSKQQIQEILEVSEEELNSAFLTPNTRSVTSFKLKQRALHVYEEAYRVAQFLSVCASDSPADNKLHQLGNLMNLSHASLQSLYECSHEALDSLVECCIQAGAYGARLTGAGWGGCVVALTNKSNADSLLKHVEAHFYNPDHFKPDLIFKTKPQPGAQVFRCDENGDCEIATLE
uniref:N-acetylgalactosamine kinase n=2 Tax=Cacopsylla melanoneura TaxID=428564 RepID=A0A8D8U0J9_9HEMI